MALHSSLPDWLAASWTKGACMVAVAFVLTLTCSAAALGQVVTTNSGPRSATLDAVNVGEDAPPGRLTGFGPPEPQTHGGSWGGAPAGDFYRVVWFQDDQPFGVVELTIPPHSVAQKLEIDYLNGISGCFGSPSGDRSRCMPPIVPIRQRGPLSAGLSGMPPPAPSGSRSAPSSSTWVRRTIRMPWASVVAAKVEKIFVQACERCRCRQPAVGFVRSVRTGRNP